VPVSAVDAALHFYKAHVEPHLNPDREETQARWQSADDGGLDWVLMSRVMMLSWKETEFFGN